MIASSAWRHRALRRFSICILFLVAIDQGVPSVLQVSEAKRYETQVQSRFENSDLFPLGPLVQHLKEHPQGPKPRVAFLGGSRIWGYRLAPDEPIPAVFQRLVSDAHVLNLGINSFQSSSAYLISKPLVHSVDTFVLFFHDDIWEEKAYPLLPKLIEVSPEDASRFQLKLPSKFEKIFGRFNRLWRLNYYSYRLQAAWFGTSTRQFVYLQMKRLLGREPRPRHLMVAEPPPASQQLAGWDAPLIPGPVSEVQVERFAARYPLLWDYGQLLVRNKRKGLFIEFSHEEVVSDEDRGVFNVYFHPYVLLVKMSVPAEWFMADRSHLTAEGARGVAWTLVKRARNVFSSFSQ